MPENSVEKPIKKSIWMRRIQKLGWIGLVLLGFNFTYQIYHRYIEPPPRHPVREQCDLHKKPCVVVLPDDQRVEFQIQPRAISLNKKLTFSVQLENIKPIDVTLILSPIGQVQYAQDIPMKNFGAGHYSAIAQLDKVMPNQKKWLVLVRLHLEEQNIVLPFKFVT